MQIKIILKSNFEAKKIQIDTTKNICLVNNAQKVINTFDFADKLCNIVLGWKSEYIGKNIIDGESFLIEICEKEAKKTYTGFNAFPQNYNKFINLLAEVL